MTRDAGLLEKLKRPLRSPYYDLSFRAKVFRQGLRERWNKPASDDPFPLPPPLLRYRVTGSFEAWEYLAVGRACALDIKDLLGRVGRDLYSFGHVLDFGCGSGRVLRYFHDRPASCRLYGVDVDRQAIAWCRKHLPFARFEANGPVPPTRFADATFDLIYAVSVFTHLDEAMQFAWLEELRRVSKPGAILILSVHGAAALFQWPEEERARIAEKGFFYKVVRRGALARFGMPAFYQVTQHSREYVEAEWSRLFKIIGYVEAGINQHQDAVILQNVPASPAAG